MIVAIIPSRYGSTRFEGKPLASIFGKPMIQWVYEQAGKASSVNDVVVATDDDRIFSAVEGFGGQAVITSAENRSGTDRVAEAAEKIGLAGDDIVINVQGDQPAFCPKSLNDVVTPFNNDPELGMSTLAFKILDKREITSKKDCKITFDTKGYALYFSRSPIPCARDDGTVFDTYKHLGIYAYTRRFLDVFKSLPTGTLEHIEKLEQLRALEYGYQIMVVVTGFDSPEVDLPQDISRVEEYMKTNRYILQVDDI
jgi:3-deoxy-manno-octulosonate cytidylyltransferase (CMP-KDO synthetase)